MGKEETGKQFEYEWYSRRASMIMDGIRLIQLGTVCCQPGYEIASHRQWCYEISYFVTGTGSFYADDKCYSISPNDVFITPFQCQHRIKVGKEAPLHFCYLGFLFEDDVNDSEITQLHTFFDEIRTICQKGNQDLLLAFYRAIGELSQSSQFSPLLLKGYIQSILILCKRTFSFISTNPHVHMPSHPSSSEIVYSIMKTIDENLSTIHSVTSLSKAIGYHPCYLSHHFKERTGMTLQEYIAQKKIEQAIGLMRFSPLNITQISEKIGFSSLQAFSKAFKRITGLSPKQYLLSINMEIS